MPTKDGLEEEINSMLGTEMEFSKMPKDDLQLLAELLDEGALLEPQAKHIAKEHSKEKVEEQIDEWYPGKYAKKVL